MNEEYFDAEGNLLDDVREQIEEKAEKIKKSQNVKTVFPIAVAGADYDEKPLYVAYFKQPSFECFSKFLRFAQNDHASAMKGLANDCFLDGDKELITDDSLFLFGLMSQLNRIVETRHSCLVNLSKPGK